MMLTLLSLGALGLLLAVAAWGFAAMRRDARRIRAVHDVIMQLTRTSR